MLGPDKLCPARKQSMRVFLDYSLSLINGSGVHDIAEDLASAFGGKGIVRRWYLLRPQLPTGIARKKFGLRLGGIPASLH
jgi:hypothetical protein